MTPGGEGTPRGEEQRSYASTRTDKDGLPIENYTIPRLATFDDETWKDEKLGKLEIFAPVPTSSKEMYQWAEVTYP